LREGCARIGVVVWRWLFLLDGLAADQIVVDRMAGPPCGSALQVNTPALLIPDALCEICVLPRLHLRAFFARF
jgi:hypothetical protein